MPPKGKIIVRKTKRSERTGLPSYLKTPAPRIRDLLWFGFLLAWFLLGIGFYLCLYDTADPIETNIRWYEFWKFGGETTEYDSSSVPIRSPLVCGRSAEPRKND